MVMNCVAYGCNNKAVKGKKISFHTFPSDINLLKEWIIALRRDKFKPTKYSRLCSEHFKEEDFVINFGRKTLKEGVIPSIFNFPENLEKKPFDKRSKILKPDEICVSQNHEEILSTSSQCKDNKLSESPPSSSTSSTGAKANISFISENKEKIPANVLENQKRKRSQLVYMGDVTAEDLKNPERFNLLWNIAKKQVSRQKKRIAYLETIVKRLKKKVKILNDLLAHQKNERKISFESHILKQVMKTKMSRKLLNDQEINVSSEKKPKLEEDANMNSSSEPTIKTESPDNFNDEADISTIKQEEVCIKDEIIEEEESEPSTSTTSKNEIKSEISADDTAVKKEVSEPSFDHVLQFKVTLKRNCWRQILVPDYYNFRDLHLAIQKSMGWQSVLFDYHLHKFELINPDTDLEDSILMPDDVPFYDGLVDGEVKNELNTKIAQYFKSPGHKARYEYDFGMGWDHEVLLEKILIPKKGETYPKCIAWKGKCPPEDGVSHSDEEKEDFDPLRCFD